MAFPGEPHDTGGSAPAPDTAGAPDTTATDVPDAISRADLDPVLAAMGSGPEIYRYDAAHAFFNERSPAYDVACATQAWDRMAAFLKAKL